MSSEQRFGAILFDRSTGVVLAAHTVFDVPGQAYRQPTLDEAWEVFGSSLAGRTKEQVDVLLAELPSKNRHAHYVDPASRSLLPKLSLKVSAPRTELQGDGKDSIPLDISLVDATGTVQTGHSPKLRVTTTRGRLSSPGGRIQMSQGKATIELTSVAETVAQVVVTVNDEHGCCLPAQLTLEFM